MPTIRVSSPALRPLCSLLAAVVLAALDPAPADAQVGLGAFGAKKLITALAEGATTCSDSTPVDGSGTSLSIAPSCTANSAVEGGLAVVANGCVDVQLTTSGGELTKIDVTVGGDAHADVLDQTTGFTKAFRGSADVQATVAFGVLGTTGFAITLDPIEPWNCNGCFFEVDLRENGSTVAFFRVGLNPVDTLPRTGTLIGGASMEVRVRSVGRVINLPPTAAVDSARDGSITLSMTFPEAQGACCSAGGACAETTISTCQGSGDFQGFGTLCATTVCGGAESFVSWANGAGGAFETAGNWEPAAVPDDGDSARFNVDATYPVSVLNGRLRRMLVDRSIVELSGGQLSLVEQSLALPSLGIRGTGQLRLLAGSLISSHAAIGDGGAVGGGMLVSGAGANWLSSGRISVGAVTASFLTIEGGGTVTSAEGRVGDAAIGLATVTGDNSTWAIAGSLAVALGAGVGADLSIRDGAAVEVEEIVQVGEAAGAEGSLSVRSATDVFAELETSSLRIGGAGSGSVAIEEGGLLRALEVIVDGRSPGEGKLTVTGPEAEVAPPLLYEVRHDGVIEIASQAKVGVTGDVSLAGAAFLAGSAVRVTVRDEAIWELNSLRIGDPLQPGVDTGGKNAIVEILAGGGIRATNVVVGEVQGASATLRVKTAGTTVAQLNAVNLRIGGAGAGSVTIEDGGFVDLISLTVAGASPGSGRLTVRGSDAELATFARTDVEGNAIVAFEDGAFVGDADGRLFGLAVVAGTAPEVAVRNGARWQLRRLEIGGPHTSGTNGTVRVADATVIVRELAVGTGGTLTGTGTVERDPAPGTVPVPFAQGGTISPGIVVDVPSMAALRPGRAATFTPGTLTLDADVVQGPTGVLRILGDGPGQAGVLHVTGALTLDGTLELGFADGYLPEAGDAFAFVQADGGLLGGFDRIVLRGVAEDLAFTTTAAGGGLTFTALSEAEPCSGAVGEDGLAACEVCDNCVDDDGDGAVDRSDADCAAAADGLGAGLGGDAAATKALLKCALTIAGGGTKLGAGVAKRLQSCTDAVLACVQTKPGDAACLTKARATCAKATSALVPGAGEGAKVRAKITKACGAVPFASLLATNGLGFGAEAARCARLLVAPLASLDALETCFERAQVCRAVEVFATRVPRARELLVLGGADASVSTCLPLGADGAAAGLDDAKTLGKPALKCQKAIAKAGAKLAARLVKGQQACSAATLACAQQGGDPACSAKAAGTCAKAAAGRPSVAGAADAGLAKAITKPCGATTLADLRAAAGLGFDAAAARCAELGVPALAALGDVATCVSREHACRVPTLGEVAVPRLRELLARGGVPLP